MVLFPPETQKPAFAGCSNYKKIGFGWTDAGAEQMARILLRRITDPTEWAEYWKKRLRLDGKVQIRFHSVKTVQP